MIRTKSRRAKVAHRCSCGRIIQPGRRYLEHVMSPNHEGMGYTGWRRLFECAQCATVYGRPIRDESFVVDVVETL
jgi:hypothetical protein